MSRLHVTSTNIKGVRVEVVEVLGGVLEPQTGLVQDHGHCVQNGPELTLFSKITEILLISAGQY